MTDIPTSPNFDFNDIRVMGPYPVIILIGQPNVAAFLEVGSFTPAQPNETSYMIRLNGGELGTPGIEITIAAPAISVSEPAITVTLAYEPGVLVPYPGEENRYNLSRFEAQWLGGSGGGGHMYDHDPMAIRNSQLDDKKRTIRVQATIHGVVPSNPATLRLLRERFGIVGSPHDRLLALLTSSDFTGKFYFRVPDMLAIQMFNDDVLSHLRRAHQLRLTPYHQYTTPKLVVSLDMDELPGFRRHMMCDRTIQGAVRTYSAPYKVLGDTTGRRDVRLVTMIHGLGICREEQVHDRYCTDLEAASVLVKLIRTRDPVLSRATRDPISSNLHGRAAEPIDHRIYMGFCKIASGFHQTPIRIPRPGSLGCISWMVNDGQSWKATGQQAFGIVLEHHNMHATMQADFVMALHLRDDALRQRASPNPAAAKSEAVVFKSVRNWHSAQRQLRGLQRLSAASITSPVLTNLRTLMQPQDLQTRTIRDLSAGPDGQHDPTTCSVANAWFLSCSMLSNHSIHEVEVLNLASRINGYIHRIRTSTGANSARSVFALMATLMLVDYRFIVAIEEPAARSEFSYRLNSFLQDMHGDPTYLNRPDLQSKRILSCSLLEVDVASVADDQATDLSSRDHPFRRRLQALFKFMLGGLAEEAVLYDTGAYHSSSLSNPPTNCTPQAWSMAARISDYLLRNPALRAQYYTDRARVLNSEKITGDDLAEIENRIKTITRAVSGEQDVVICDYNTAMSRDMAKSFEKHIVIFGNTHRITFSRLASVVVHHSNIEAAILLGQPADQRFGPLQLASRGRNEAMTSFGRSAWDVLETCGGSPATNLV